MIALSVVAPRRVLVVSLIVAACGWAASTQAETDADINQVLPSRAAAVGDLTDLEAKEYVEKAPALSSIGLAVPGTVVTLRLRGGKQLKINIGDQVKKEGSEETLYYCTTSDSQQVYKVGEMVVKDLPEKAEELKEEAPAATPSAPVPGAPAGGAAPKSGSAPTPPPSTD